LIEKGKKNEGEIGKGRIEEGKVKHERRTFNQYFVIGNPCYFIATIGCLPSPG